MWNQKIEASNDSRFLLIRKNMLITTKIINLRIIEMIGETSTKTDKISFTILAFPCIFESFIFFGFCFQLLKFVVHLKWVKFMGGYDDHVAVIGDWIPPSPSPRAFFSSVISDDIVARSSADSGSKNKSVPLFWSPGNVVQIDQARASAAVSEEASNSNALAETQMTSRGGLMERMAARAGFNAPRLNTNSIRPADLSKSPEIRSPYLTIPPGLSPTTLLDSPVFLSNSLVLPSPTTGKFLFAPTGNNLDSSLMTEDPDKGKESTFEDVNASSFAFKPVAEFGSFPCFNTVNKVNPSGFSPLSFANVGGSCHSETSVLCPSIESAKSHSQDNGALFQQANFPKSHAENNGDSNISSEQTYNSVGVAEHSPPLDEPQEEDGDHRNSGDPNVSGGPSEDGYNWRKYGQKQVKGSEYPRSYYKCTHPNCPVKKKVERSEEGHITEIIYKGAHNHPRPPPNRRSILGSSNAPSGMQLHSEQPGIGCNDAIIWQTLQQGKPAGAHDWKQESFEATSSAPLGQDYSIGATALHSQTGQLELADGIDGSSTFSNDDDDDDRATHGSVSLVFEGEGDELESKRRRVETYASEISGATRAIREPRVVVQTTSEVDILDDGYRWRKYGQKVVKGNPNPRSYYKCTSPGCNVRKHVERASHDLKSVITTYEGKHNHDVPAARNSSHVNSSSLPPQQAPVSAGSSLIHRPQPSQIQGNCTSHFERPSLASFGRPQLGPGPGPGPGFGFGINQSGLASLGMAGLGPNQGRLPGIVFPIHSYLGNQGRPMNNNMGFMLPKGEPKMEPVTDSGLNSSNAVSVYQQLMSRLPLGPQM